MTFTIPTVGLVGMILSVIGFGFSSVIAVLITALNDGPDWSGVPFPIKGLLAITTSTGLVGVGCILKWWLTQ